MLVLEPNAGGADVTVAGVPNENPNAARMNYAFTTLENSICN